MKRAIVLSCVALASCAPSQDTKGTVHQYNGETVTIRGVYDMSPVPGVAEPTDAMREQARQVCPEATYLSATPSPTDNYTFLYLFKC